MEEESDVPKTLMEIRLKAESVHDWKLLTLADLRRQSNPTDAETIRRYELSVAGRQEYISDFKSTDLWNLTFIGLLFFIFAASYIC